MVGIYIMIIYGIYGWGINIISWCRIIIKIEDFASGAIGPVLGDVALADVAQASLPRHQQPITRDTPNQGGAQPASRASTPQPSTATTATTTLHRLYSDSIPTPFWLNSVSIPAQVVCKFVFTCIAVGCPISCGVFTPVFLIGAAAGRLFGELRFVSLSTSSIHNPVIYPHDRSSAASSSPNLVGEVNTVFVLACSLC